MLALAGLTMRVDRGEVFGFLGPNGAGKTTAVKLLLGLARRTSGRASVLGAPLGERGVRARIGYLPELFRYQGWLTGREVVALHGELSGVAEGRADRLAAADQALRTVDLLDRADDRVATYSKGMQQRLGLAVALLGRPELVILDEPTSALDPLGRADVRDLVRRLSGDGVTVFLNSHLLGEVEQVCDRVAIVDRGRVIAAGPPSDLLGDAVLLVRATRLESAPVRSVIERHRLRLADGALTGHVAPAAVPELIAALVAAGAAIHSVEQRRRSLEEAFRDLVAESADARAAA